MLKTVLTPKNIVFTAFVVMITGVAAYLIVVSTGIKFPTQEEKKEITTEEVDPTGMLPYSIIGPIKNIDRQKDMFVMTDTTNKKEYTVKFSDETKFFKGNVQKTAASLNLHVFLAVYSNSKFNEKKTNSDFSYILISDKPGKTEEDTKNTGENVPGQSEVTDYVIPKIEGEK